MGVAKRGALSGVYYQTRYHHTHTTPTTNTTIATLLPTLRACLDDAVTPQVVFNYCILNTRISDATNIFQNNVKTDFVKVCYNKLMYQFVKIYLATLDFKSPSQSVHSNGDLNSQVQFSERISDDSYPLPCSHHL